MVLFTIASVVPIAVDLVGMHRFRVETKTHAIEFYLTDQIKSLVVIVPADSIHEAYTIDQADTEFGTKLCVRSSLAAYDGAYMRLAYTHDPVIYAASVLFVHPHLLTKHLGDDQ